MPGSPPSAGTTNPESSASAGRPLAAGAAGALSFACASNVVPVSSGSGNPSAPALTTSMPNGRSRSSISASLPLLWVAITSLGWRKRRGSGKAQRLPLKDQELADALARERQQPHELGLGEDGLLRGRLHLHDAAGAREHEVGVGFGRGTPGGEGVEQR